MFVREINDLAGSDKEMVVTEGARVRRSVRILTRDDGCGFAISDVLFKGGWTLNLHYKNHVEANYIVSGQAEVLDLTSDKKWELSPGTLYVVGPKDRHRLSAEGDVHLISIFNPAITGTERHDADGAFGPTGEIPPAWRGDGGRTMFVMREEDAASIELTVGRVKVYRYLIGADGCGFTVSSPRGSVDSILWYKNHVEANYVLEGEATVEDLTTGEKWEIRPGSLYVVGPRDRHRLLTKGDIYLMCVFNPPLKGDEFHDSNGTYPPSGEVPPAWRA